jgi:hypothetical protein
MEYSLIKIRQYQKCVKSKRTMDSSLPSEKESDEFGSNFLTNSVLGGPELFELNSYHDSHLFMTNFNSI